MTTLIAQTSSLGSLRVPRGARLQVDRLAREVGEYFDRGAQVGPCDVVFDVGANIGAFSVEAARRGGAIELHAFEPVPPIFDALRSNLEHHDAFSRSRCTATRAAVRDEAGATELSYFLRFPTDSTCDLGTKRRDFNDFFRARGTEIGRSLSSSEGAAACLGATFSRISDSAFGRWLADQVTGRVRMSCESRTLSEVLRERGVERVDLLKVDVEGDETRVLDGIDPSHRRRIGQVVLEAHDHEGRAQHIAERLRAMGLTELHASEPDGARERGLKSVLFVASRPEARLHAS